MFKPPRVYNLEILPGPSGLSTKKEVATKHSVSSSFRPLVTFYRRVRCLQLPGFNNSETLPGPSGLSNQIMHKSTACRVRFAHWLPSIGGLDV